MSVLLLLARGANAALFFKSSGAVTASYRMMSSAAGSRVIDVANDQEFKEQLKKIADSNSLGIIDFTAKWCGPCKAVAPIYDQLSTQHPGVTFLKVDIDSQELLNSVMDHNVTAVPTFAFYKGAQRIDGFSGARLDLLKELIAKHG